MLMVLALLSLSMTTGCLLRSHRVEPKPALGPLKSATQQELVEKVAQMAASVRTMNATVDVDTTVGGEKKGTVTEYQQIRGYILAQKPRTLRMIGLLPIVRNKAFDMVSDGNGFKLSIPPRNRFIVGSDKFSKPSANPLENLRPQVIYDALLTPAIDPADEIAVMEEGSQQVLDEHTRKMVTQPTYHLLVLRRSAQGVWHLYRKIYFSREDLEPYRQTIFNEDGTVATEAIYSAAQDYNGVRFPSLIEIQRPQEEYSIAIKIVKLTLNEPLRPEQFELEMPAGAVLTELR
jgi:hypothetical protein